ncbi:hypothetical protein V1525DRAFT_335067 [Lipomyces kononenkoae]|uniref:Uncharacterized protein n=1 Tax=Lipomyces kononenkoae TaxID=34357 RepID=A0ACC3TBG4_LIPKO
MSKEWRPDAKRVIDQRQSPTYFTDTARTAEQSLGLPAFRTIFACLSMHMTDRLRFLRFPKRDVSQVEAAIQRFWSRGIQDTRTYGESYEVKLHGHPWRPTSWGNEKIDACRLICQILNSLFDMGWVLKASVDISTKEFDKDTLLFRYQNPPPSRCTWIGICFGKGDKMYILDGPPELGRTLVNAFGSDIQSHNVNRSVFEIKFHGYPWRAHGTETVHARLILLTLLECLEQHGFSLYASVRQVQDAANDGYSETDTWFCNRQINWTPGMPIYHN